MRSASGNPARETDWERLRAQTDDEIAAAVREDPDAAPLVDASWFARARLVSPEPKEQISIRLDRDLLQHFRQFPKYQTRINRILRVAMEYDRAVAADDGHRPGGKDEPPGPPTGDPAKARRAR